MLVKVWDCDLSARELVSSEAKKSLGLNQGFEQIRKYLGFELAAHESSKSQ
jgi:hypothetical protein